MGRKEILRIQFQLNPQQSQHRNPLLSWDQLLVFDIELENKKLPLPLSLLLEGARSLNGSAIATLDMLGTPPLMDLGIERDDMLKRVLA